MKRQTELELIDKIRASASERRSEADPGPTTLDVDRYHDPDYFSRERDAVFRKRWLTVGHVGEVRAPGDFFATKLTGVSLLVVRGKDGRVRAFRNVCRHRGARVATGRGCEKSFTCPYHGWTYGLDGQLLGIPEQWGFEGVDRAEHGLVEASTATSDGVLHVWLGSGPAPPLEHQSELAGFLGASDVTVIRREKTVQANWKVIVDGALESYHLKRTHAETIYPMFLDNIAAARRLGDDVCVVLPKRSIRDLAEDRTAWRLREHANIVYVRYPNALVLVLGDHSMLLWLDPESADRTRIHSMMIVPPDEGRERYWAANEELFQVALDEDYEIAESIQDGMQSGANTATLLASFERGIRLFHDIVNGDM